MKIFIDTAEVKEIKELNSMGFVAGVTTNPSLILKSGRDFVQVLKEICQIVDGPISAEVTAEDAQGMIKEGEDYAKLHPNVIIKVPMTPEGLKATHAFTKKGIKTNVTLIFSANQALLAALAGATYVSPFLGRLDDISEDGLGLIETIANVFVMGGLDCQIIAASIRSPYQITKCALAGAHVATVPPKILSQMLSHPLTDEGIEKFNSDWAQVRNMGKAGN